MYSEYLKLIMNIENGDFSSYKEIFKLMKRDDSRLALLSDLVWQMSSKPNSYLSYTIGEFCKLNCKRPDYLTDDINNNVIKYVRALCSKTKENETFTINFRGGLISTIACFGQRFRKQFHKLIRWHPISFISITDMPSSINTYERQHWISDNLSISQFVTADFEKINNIKFRAANEIEYEVILSDLILWHYKKIVRGQYDVRGKTSTT